MISVNIKINKFYTLIFIVLLSVKPYAEDKKKPVLPEQIENKNNIIINKEDLELSEEKQLELEKYRIFEDYQLPLSEQQRIKLNGKIKNADIKKDRVFIDKELISKDRRTSRVNPNITYELSLERSIGIGINNSFDLKAIKARREINNLTISEKLRDYFPTLSFSYLQTEEVERREPDTRQHKLSVNSDIVIYDGGARSLSYNIAKLEYLQARNDYKIALNQLVHQIRSSHFQLLQLKKSAQIYEKTLEQSKEQLKFITREYELGEATKIDKLEVETKVKGIERTLEESKDSYNSALNQFKLLLKIDYRQPIDITGDIQNSFVLKPIKDKFSVEELISMAMAQRKEIESSYIEYLISQKKYELAKHYYYPKVSLGLNYSLTDEEYFPHQKGWGVSLKVSGALWGNSISADQGYSEEGNGGSRIYSNSASLNIMDSMSYKRAIVDSKINYYTARQNEKDVKQQISTEILNSYTSLKNSWSMIEISRSQVELYNAQLQIELLKANLGDTRRYDLVEKQIEKAEAEVSHLDAIVKYLVAASSLEISLGTDIGFLQIIKKAR